MGKKQYITNVKPKDNFSIISNDFINNKDLTPNARFILIAILSKPSDFKINKSSYHLQLGMGRKAFIAGFNLLVDKGYIKEVKYKADNNLYVYEYYISSEPQYLTVVPPGVNPLGLTEQGLPASAYPLGLTERGKHNNTDKKDYINNTDKENYINNTYKEDTNLEYSINIENDNNLNTVLGIRNWLKNNKRELSGICTKPRDLIDNLSYFKGDTDTKVNYLLNNSIEDLELHPN